MSGAAGLQAEDIEAYRRHPYPTLIHNQNSPERLATIATIAGMTPPDVRTARVLEVGVGNGINLVALAVAWPQASFTGIDIEPEAIEVGREWVSALGLTNIRLEVLDLVDAADRLGEFDYIVAHGVFAWVPPPVADALLALIGRLLAPNGVAMVSFNALPGCYHRIAIRDIMLRAAAGATTPDQRLERGRAALAPIVEARSRDSVEQAAFRATARQIANKRADVLIHDELGPHFRPRHLADVLTEARAHGLAFLGDSDLEWLSQSLLGEDAADEAAVVERACAADEGEFRTFRNLMLIRDTARPARTPTPALIETLYAASGVAEPDPGFFVTQTERIEIEHPEVLGLLRRLRAAWPARVRLKDLDLSQDMLMAAIQLFQHELVTPYTVEAPYAAVPGERPVASPLARLMVERGEPLVASLNHYLVKLDDHVGEAVLALDGRADDGRFDAAAARANLTREEALRDFAAFGMLMPER